MRMRIRHSLFFRFFWTLVLLGVLPMAISSFFLVATYQSRITDKVSLVVAEELFRNASIQFFLIFLFVLIIATFSAFIVSRNVSRPLRTLTQAARLIGEGNFDVKINVARKDEIGTLGEFFNEMVGSIKEVNERQKEISRLKSEFITVAAHQLRTPLSVMKWSHHMILDGDAGRVPIKQRDFIQKAEIANESMIRLVHNLLDAARIEEGRFGYKFEETDLGVFLQRLYEEKKLFAEKSSIALSLDIKVTGSVSMQADAERLSMAIGNIIDNAIRYTPKGGSIVVGFELEGDKALVTIRDTGVGIAHGDQERLFTKFYRGANVMHVETGGTGLGLFIAKNVIEGHGGTISFESEQGKGTTFFMRLPLGKSAEAPKDQRSFDAFVKSI